MPAVYSPTTADLIRHLERLGHGELLALLQDPEVYKRNNKLNLSELGRKLGVSQTTAKKIYLEMVSDARVELEKA